MNSPEIKLKNSLTNRKSVGAEKKVGKKAREKKNPERAKKKFMFGVINFITQFRECKNMEH
jgi:hypothetical protein